MRSSEGFILAQLHYVDKILGKFSKDDSGIARTPIDTGQHLSKNKCESVDQVEYARMIGSLMYLMSCIRLDIAFTVNNLSRFITNPVENHGKAIVRVLRYLKYTRDYELYCSRDSVILEGFSNGSWIYDIQDTKGTSGYLMLTLARKGVQTQTRRGWGHTRTTWVMEISRPVGPF
ncbi:Zinc finger, CCHC-type [Gossypium australe]|uniref:Zinc finger, CCHC-type n=1 Tax=Gossypium australe TaxID=47621 RepID=A0A5B6WPX4_9ROSI|nr:Zinc finger, CCHC-type [Gossypium australe]